jgi:hypothetical protein
MFKANLCKAGILRLTSENIPELACDGAITPFHLSDEVLRRNAHTFDGLPVVINHNDDIDIDDVVGINKGTWVSDGYLKAILHIWDPIALDGIRRGYRRQCSIGFSSHYSDNPAFAHDGATYHKIIGSYIALVPAGACGEDCAIRGIIP